MKKTYYVLVEIGCLECGNESNVLGIFTDKADADALCEKYTDAVDEIYMLPAFWYEVYEVGELDVLTPPCERVVEYLVANTKGT